MDRVYESNRSHGEQARGGGDRGRAGISTWRGKFFFFFYPSDGWVKNIA